jgi:hypothetical protein
MTKSVKQEAAQELGNILKDIQTDTIYTVIRHVSASGMQREISVKMIDAGRIIHLDYLVSTATGKKLGKHGGIVMKGFGMDMGFALVDGINHLFSPSKKFRQEWI